MDIELIQWPSQRERRKMVAEQQRPRLLLVATDAEPPRSTDLLEDWVRLPSSDRDVRARVRDLQQRIAAHQLAAPTIDHNGVLRHARKSVALSNVQARLAGTLLANMDRVVSRRELIETGWDAAPTERNTLDVHMTRLRRRVSEVGLSIRTVRARGFILETQQSAE